MIENGILLFLQSVYYHQYEMLCIIIAVSILYGFIIKKIFLSIFDPLFVNFIFSICAISVPIYMFFFDIIDDDKYFFYCICAELAYMIGLFVFTRKINIVVSKSTPISFSEKEFVLHVLSLIYFCTILISYYQYGVPLLKGESHALAAATNGFITKLNATILPIIVFLLAHKTFMNILH